MEPFSSEFKIRKIEYGKLFRLLAEQERAMTAAKPLLVGQGELLPGCCAMVILWPGAKSRQCDPPEPEALT